MTFESELAEPSHLSSRSLSSLSTSTASTTPTGSSRAAGGERAGAPRRRGAAAGARGDPRRPRRRSRARWEAIVARFATLAERHGYGLVHTPMFEDAAGLPPRRRRGSEIVTKEMYEFEDKGGRHLALRPEGTASVVRAFVQHRPPTPWKAWYVTPAFRYEQPQAGRYRQHHQLGVEVLGTEDPDLDVEVIALAARLLRGPRARQRSRCGSTRSATPDCRPAYLEALTAYLATAAELELCDEHRDDVAPQPAAGPRLQARRVPRGHRGRPPPRRPALRALRGPLRPRPRGPRALSASRGTTTTGSCAASTTTRARRSSSPAPPSSRRRTRSAAAGATTVSPRRSAARRRRASASGSGIERILLACDAEGVFAVDARARSTCSSSTSPAGRAARDLDARRCDVAGVRGRARLRRTFDEGPAEAADRSGAPLARDHRAERARRGHRGACATSPRGHRSTEPHRDAARGVRARPAR